MGYNFEISASISLFMFKLESLFSKGWLMVMDFDFALKFGDKSPLLSMTLVL